MPTLTGLPTLWDAAKLLDPDGTSANVAEVLDQDNEMLWDCPFYEGNLPTGTRITTRTGLPAVYWRKLNKGIPESKATTAQVDETTGLLEARSQVDVRVAALNGNTAGFRFNQSKPFMEAMNQKAQFQMLNGTLVGQPEAFLGIAPRFSDLSAPNADNIIDAGGTGANLTSIYLIGWAPDKVYGIFPKGSKAGLTHRDLGEGDAFDDDGNRFRALMDLYTWDLGIALHDWRYVVRIANIDVTALRTNANAGANLIKLLAIAEERIQSLVGVSPAYYMNRTLRAMLRLQLVDAVKNSTLTMEMAGGRRVMFFGEVPVRRVDQLKIGEDQVVAS
ncbi:TPA: major capsid protein [Klebsiella variicola]